MSAVCGPYRPFPTFMRAGGGGGCSQLSLAALSSGRATAAQGPLGMGSVIAAGHMALKSKYKIQLTGSSGL